MFRKNTLSLLAILYLCFILSGCSFIKLPGQATVEQVDNEMTKEAVNDSFSDIKNAIIQDNKYAMSGSTKAAQKEVTDLADELAGYTIAEEWWQAAKPNIVRESTYNDKLAKLNGAVEKYNTAKLNDQVFIDAKNGKLKVSNKLKTLNYGPFIMLAAIVGLMLFILAFLYLNNKRPSKDKKPKPKKLKPKKETEECVEVVQDTSSTLELEDKKETKRLSVDYPLLLQQDCNTLDLDYNSVLEDFNGNAEKAYETVHVQALQKQYD